MNERPGLGLRHLRDRVPRGCASGSASGGTANCCSPASWSGARLVTSTLERGGGLQQGGNLHGGGEDLLEVIQHQQELPVAQRGLQRRLQRLIAAFAHAERLGNRGDDQRRIASAAPASTKRPHPRTRA